MMTVDKTRFPNVARSNPKLHYSDLKVLRSGGGWYLGRTCWKEGDEECFIGSFEEPYSRESYYFGTREEAEAALAGEFTKRQCIENEMREDRGDLPKLPTRSFEDN